MNLHQYISIKDFGVDIHSKCLSECVKKAPENLFEHASGIDKKFVG
jgi:hypothetical protein